MRNYCQECMEIKDLPDRSCDICGALLVDPPSQSSSADDNPVPTLLQQVEMLLNLTAENENDGLPGGGPLGQAGQLDEVAIQALLQQFAGLTEGGGAGTGREGFLEGFGRGATQGTPEEVISRLMHCVLHKTSLQLLSVQLTVKAVIDGEDKPKLLKMDALPGDFSPVPPDNGKFEAVLADPLTGGLFKNADKMRNRCVIMQRGVTSFGKMTSSAEEAGAVGVILVNHVDVWPYLMKDTKGEASKATIWIMMVPKSMGEALVQLVKDKEETGGGVELSLSVSSVENECLICQELFMEGAQLIRLPCSHAYHESCVLKWLKINHTCPACRFELPTAADAKMSIPGMASSDEDAQRRMFS